MNETSLMGLVIGISAFGLIWAYYLAKWVLKKDTGTEAMQAISNAIKEGAEAFIKRQFKTIIILALVFAAFLFIGYGFLRSHQSFDPVDTALSLAFWISLSFSLGAACSLVAGYIGMWISIRTNIRTAAGTMKSVNEGLRIALRGGAVSGLLVVAMSLLGVSGLYILVRLTTAVDPARIPFLIIGYGFGASFVALFAQLGGGIYTKAADVGADLVGKVEAGIPEDDPRNPAVIADLVGDNVGDCAGRGADLFESTAAENIGAMILGAVMAAQFPLANPAWVLGVMLFPLVARAFGIIASVVGIMAVKVKENEDPMKSLNRGYYLAVILAMLGFGLATRLLLYNEAVPNAWLYFFACGIIGVVTSMAFVFITQYYTEYKYRPVKSIAEASQTGPATNIISGIAVGLESTALPVLVISAAILSAYYLGKNSGFPNAGLFGTAVATMGMLATAAYILAMDTFGPIADNAGGIVEMSKQPAEAREKSDRLDAVGNTTKALTKGYAIGSAALAAFLLFSAYLDEVRNYGTPLESVDIAKPAVFVGGLLGAMLVFLFSALAIRAVGRAAYYVINDVRAQFKEKPGILAGTDKPDYGRCVDIVTKGALKEMIAPGLLAILFPIAVGMGFRLLGIGAEAVAAMLMVGTIAGILMALFFNNGGGAWDNAKKFIEMGNYGGKGSDTHKAAVVGDTVGDPFKDTAGPSIHVLIKLLATITLVLAPLFI
ncbi:MAG: sodium-translocating pyrophosphatase [Candidatus Buchananbacteria bacterium RIFCSPHIGHO2_01_FULL_46_12]|uniref:K(+)-insensitive pyrophosphate-energized proton pump n=3 Tax=Candidatus Buchananiibacteriota TaxID=1817903 RepID=A0A1G1YKW8_9BACT|nr:MAG: sodium-translocating pyrophosphatase [Candidatus Buchananbacteria bacterium RIFCSPHIGHO2_01_FULL_46_12]OGY52982.1 MAG: sodium-translocating pyrophosphatase [Candidatus Buchananbacteria bacterium RIFCSPLOWO2_01_FULL_45_31]